MYKILLCGSDEKFISQMIKYEGNKYNLIGYVGDRISVDLKHYQFEQISELDFDYIVISESSIGNKSGIDIQHELRNVINVPACKIIEGASFYGDSRNPLRQFAQDSETYNGLVFGLSHSFFGFLPEYMDKKFYVFSSPSQDLFFAKSILEYLKNIPSLLQKCTHEYFIFEMPYYYFNYDLSRCTAISKTRMNYFNAINRYHHLLETDAGRKQISHYRFMHDIFFKGLEQEKLKKTISATQPSRLDSQKISILKENLTAFPRDKIRAMQDGRFHVWTKLRQDTIAENIQIWKSIQELVMSINSSAKICIVIFPFNFYFRESHNDIIKVAKKSFLDALKNSQSSSIKIFDFFDWNKNPDEFNDESHLNKYGSIKFSKDLNQFFHKNFY